MGVGDDDMRHRLAAHGIEQRGKVGRVDRPRIHDCDLAATDDVAERPLECERARIVSQDAPHAGHDIVHDARSEIENAIERNVLGHSGMTFYLTGLATTNDLASPHGFRTSKRVHAQARGRDAPGLARPGSSTAIERIFDRNGLTSCA